LCYQPAILSCVKLLLVSNDYMQQVPVSSPSLNPSSTLIATTQYLVNTTSRRATSGIRYSIEHRDQRLVLSVLHERLRCKCHNGKKVSRSESNKQAQVSKNNPIHQFQSTPIHSNSMHISPNPHTLQISLIQVEINLAVLCLADNERVEFSLGCRRTTVKFARFRRAAHLSPNLTSQRNEIRALSEIRIRVEHHVLGAGTRKVVSLTTGGSITIFEATAYQFQRLAIEAAAAVEVATMVVTMVDAAAVVVEKSAGIDRDDAAARLATAETVVVEYAVEVTTEGLQFRPLDIGNSLVHGTIRIADDRVDAGVVLREAEAVADDVLVLSSPLSAVGGVLDRPCLGVESAERLPCCMQFENRSRQRKQLYGVSIKSSLGTPACDRNSESTTGLTLVDGIVLADRSAPVHAL
ncbi:hypothetical protein KCU76_g99, partial [Aureobasidium melanogenum]